MKFKSTFTSETFEKPTYFFSFLKINVVYNQFVKVGIDIKYK